MNWALNNLELVLQLTLTHLIVSLIPLAIGFVIAVLLARVTSNRFAPAITGSLGALYAIPSLALFVTLPVILGTNFVGPTNVLIALTIYVVSAMFFSARDAFAALPKPTLEFAQAQGLSAIQRFFYVELPLATPGLIAGSQGCSGQHDIHGFNRSGGWRAQPGLFVFGWLPAQDRGRGPHWPNCHLRDCHCD